ncbi:hypothetical protein AB0C59_25020 [Streptomyces sp. NPDC048664]|uniref:hypothetical protein n=1 Tax=Streptomyces sp. NPDC048664 TaxID=3154505 RepID=UPI00342708CB
MEVREAADAPGVDAPAPGGAPARRSGRTPLLIAVAAVTGVVAGTCVGYVVQADRKPTALPSLSQPVLAQAKGRAPEPLSAVADRRVKRDGDLRDLLLPRPRGARSEAYEGSKDGWLPLDAYADNFDRPAGAFWEQLGMEFRRAAATSWREGDSRFVDVRLVQYRQEEQIEAVDVTTDANQWAESKGDTRSVSVPGTGDGMAYVHTRQDGGLYYAEAHAWRGDIVMEAWIYDTKPIPQAAIRDVAKRQMERL